jgi:hypothetical protein
MSMPASKGAAGAAEPGDHRLDVADHLQFAATQLDRSAVLVSGELSPLERSAEIASNAASAASMPDFIAVWLPLIRGTLTKPAEQPISAPPGKSERRHRLPAALVDRPGAVGDAAAALQHFADRRMLLPALEFLERREPGVAVVERDDEAERDLVFAWW